jgi:UDP-N-acetylmuramyl pentapeptide phosphotransferase/UDP-N-acetylglucosamine-1-phosphate transferase
MNTKRITFALIAAATFAVVVAVAALRFAVGIDGLIGYGAVIALIAMAAVEYRLDLRRVFGGK